MKEHYNFDEVNTLKKKLDALRPLDAEIFGKIRHKLSIDWIYNSNAIEGNTLSLSETKFFLEVGLTSKGKPLSEYLETKNHQHAINYLYEVLKDSQNNRILTEGFIKEVHAMLFERNEKYKIENEKGETVYVDVLPGTYKKQDNYVLLPDGSRKNYLDPLQTVGAMQALIEFYAKNFASMHPIQLAAQIHTQFVAIHPFVDGNGRVARIIMNLILMQAGYPPAIIQNELKQDYYESLRQYDETKTLDSFIAILEQEVIKTLQITLNAAQGKSILDTDDIEKRTLNFANKMSALDKDIGVVTKKVTREEKERSIRNIRDYFADLAQKKLSDIQSELFNFEVEKITSIDALGDVIGLVIDKLSSKNIASELVLRYQNIADEYADYIQKSDDGSCMCINLKSSRAYIPSASCVFLIIPTKYTLCVCSILSVTELNSQKDEEYERHQINFIQNGVVWEDWNSGDLETFFAETFEQYLALIETEAEHRRLLFAEDET